ADQAGRRRFPVPTQFVERLDNRGVATEEDAGVLRLERTQPAIGRSVGIVFRRPDEIFWVQSGELKSMLQSLEAFGRKRDGHWIVRNWQRAMQHDVVTAAGEANQLPLICQIFGQFRDRQVLNEDAVKTLVEPA